MNFMLLVSSAWEVPLSGLAGGAGSVGNAKAEGAAWSQEAWALMGALWLTCFVTRAGHATSLQTCFQICKMALHLGHLQGPFQL